MSGKGEITQRGREDTSSQSEHLRGSVHFAHQRVPFKLHPVPPYTAQASHVSRRSAPDLSGKETRRGDGKEGARVSGV